MKGSSVSHLLLTISLTLCSLIAQAAPPKAILKLPFTIKKPGAYQLTRNLAFQGTGNAIQVEADDVTIDLKGYTIAFEGVIPAGQQPAGIYALDRRNITIRNGVTRGFYRGIFLDTANVQFGVGGHLVENIRADLCVAVGIEVEGRNSVLRSNWVSTVRQGPPDTLNTYGMRVSGSGVMIQSNRIIDVYVNAGNGANVAYGISVDGGDSCRVLDNQISTTNLSVSLSKIGVRLNNCPFSIVADNHIARSFVGIQFEDCGSLMYRDNTATAAGLPYSNDGSADAGTGNLP